MECAPRAGRVRRVAAWLAVLALGCVGDPAPPPPPAPAPPAAASLSGRLRAVGEARASADLARSVVYLEPIPAEPLPAASRAVELRHRAERLAPGLVTVAPGDTLWLVNDDRIFHGAFSYSRPNHFDLGAYGPGEKRPLRFEHAGPVRIHCPFHPEEARLVLVVPSRLVVLPGRRGAYELRGVAPGRYWLRAWADGLPEVAYDVTLRPGETAFRDVVWPEPAPSNGAGGGAAAAPAP